METTFIREFAFVAIVWLLSFQFVDTSKEFCVQSFSVSSETNIQRRVRENTIEERKNTYNLSIYSRKSTLSKTIFNRKKICWRPKYLSLIENQEKKKNERCTDKETKNPSPIDSSKKDFLSEARFIPRIRFGRDRWLLSFLLFLLEAVVFLSQ